MAPSVQRRKVWLTPTTRVPCSNAAKTRSLLKFAGCPKLANRSQPLVGRSSLYCKDMWGRYCCLTSFFPINKHFTELTPQNGGKNSWHRYDIKRNCVIVTLCIQVLIFNSRNLHPSNQKSMVLAVHVYGSPSTRRHAAASCMGSRALVSDGERAARCRRPSWYIGLSTHVDTNNTPAGNTSDRRRNAPLAIIHTQPDQFTNTIRPTFNDVYPYAFYFLDKCIHVLTYRYAVLAYPNNNRIRFDLPILPL